MKLQKTDAEKQIYIHGIETITTEQLGYMLQVGESKASDFMNAGYSGTMSIGNIADVEEYINDGTITTKKDLKDAFKYARDSVDGSFDSLLEKMYSKNFVEVEKFYNKNLNGIREDTFKIVDLLNEIETYVDSNKISKKMASILYSNFYKEKIKKVISISEQGELGREIQSYRYLFTTVDYENIRRLLSSKILVKK